MECSVTSCIETLHREILYGSGWLEAGVRCISFSIHYDTKSRG
jgi:hypothetical protein